MGRFITEIIVYESKEWTPEDLISWGYTLARRHSDITIEIAAHIFNSAFIHQDNELFDAARELMNAAGSPCQYVANDNAEQATSNYNRPSEPAGPVIPLTIIDNIEDTNEEWDNSLDGIFDEKIKPWEVKKAIDAVPSSEKIQRDRRFYYVGYRILKVIKWIPMETSESDYLRWVNFHFGCGWEKNRNQKKAFLFSLEGTVVKLGDLHPSDWKDDTLYSDLGKHYRSLAISFKNKFTQTIVKGNAVDDSESYEHLKDRAHFLRGAKFIFDKWIVPPEAYINNGQ